jgi:hypothetical protein
MDATAKNHLPVATLESEPDSVPGPKRHAAR